MVITRPGGRHLYLFLLLSCTLIFPGRVRSQDCHDYSANLRWQAGIDPEYYVYASAVSGPFLYTCDSGYVFRVFDISDPGQPVQLGQTGTSINARSMVATGGVCYLANQYADSLQIMDVSDSFQPVSAGMFYVGAEADLLAVAGDHLFVTRAGDESLQVFDISIPLDPQPAATVQLGMIASRALRIEGDLLYLASSGTLLVLDIANPVAPDILCSLELPGPLFALDVSGDTVCITGYETGVTVYDFADPCTPITQGFLAYPAMEGYSRAIHIQGDQALVALSYNEYNLLLVDLTDPWNPVQEGAWNAIPNPAEIHAAGGDRLVLRHGYGVDFLLMGNGRQAQPFGSWETGDLALSVAVEGSLAYLAAYGDGLRVVDLSDPQAAVALGAVAAPGAVWDLALSGSLVYLAEFTGLSVVSVADPSAPLLAGHLALSPIARAVLPTGDQLCVGLGYAETGGLQVVDVSNPTVPVPRGFLDLGSSVWGLARTGDLVLAGSGWDESGSLQVIDIADPDQPVLVGSLPIDGIVRDVAVAGGHAFLAAGQAGLVVADISDPAAPELVGQLSLPGTARRVSITGSFLFLASEEGGTHILDVTDPLDIGVVGWLESGSEAWAVEPAGNCLVVADYENGLTVAPFPCWVSAAVMDPPIVSRNGRLGPNFPDPFNPGTHIPFNLEKITRVSLQVYDLSGRLVRTLVAEDLYQAGRHQVWWNGRDEAGRTVGAGVYLVRLQGGGRSEAESMVLLK
jgi:hypothetical protein